MSKVVTIDLRTKEQKRLDRKEAFRKRRQQIAQFIVENKEIVIPAATTCILGACTMTTKLVKMHRTKMELDFKKRSIYDRSLGCYIELKRPLRTSEALQIEERRNNGEPLTMVLESMHLLKR